VLDNNVDPISYRLATIHLLQTLNDGQQTDRRQQCQRHRTA